MKATKRKKDCTNLDHLPKLYGETKDLGLVAQEILPFLMKVPRAFTTDIDIKSDFLLHFYEKLDIFFETYERYIDSPFTPFLLKYSKNLFSNFIRSYRCKKIIEVPYYESFTDLGVETSLCYYDAEKYQEEDERILDRLPMKYRLTLKLYLGVPLNLEELKCLVDIIQSPEKVTDFLIGRYKRKESKLQRIETKGMYKRGSNIGEAIHLAKLFSVSKSTISRRLQFSFYFLHKEDF